MLTVYLVFVMLRSLPRSGWLCFVLFMACGCPFSKVVLDLIDSRVQYEHDFLSLDVVSFLVYRAAAPSVYDHPECGSPLVLGGMANLDLGKPYL